MTNFDVQLSCLFNCIILSFKDTFNWTKFENSHWKWPWNTVVDSITHQKICDVPWFSIVFLSLPGSIDSLILLCNTSVSIHSPEDRTTGGRAPGVGVCPGPSTDWMNAKISWPDVIRCCWNRVIKKKSPGKKSPCLRVVCVFSIWVVYSWFSTISSHKKKNTSPCLWDQQVYGNVGHFQKHEMVEKITPCLWCLWVVPSGYLT